MTSPSEQQVIRTRCKSTRSVDRLLKELDSELLARTTNATRRASRKCSTTQLLMSFWGLCASDSYSFDAWAAEATHHIRGTISGMAVCKRMGDDMISFLKALLQASLAKRKEPLFRPSLFSQFTEVLLQDATHFKLPQTLAKYFPGSKSRRDNAATAKVQAVLSLTSGSLVDLKLGCFRDNDQGDSPRIAAMVKKGALVIRDLGYFTLDAFRAIEGKGGYFLSRFKGEVIVFDTNGQRIHLLNHLKKHGGMDQEVVIGIRKKFQCRMVAIELPPDQAAKRIRKAKVDRSGSANHGPSYYALLNYSIYITNVNTEIWTTFQVAETYRCRWFIETLFKGWKTGLGMDFNVPGRYAKRLRVEYYMYARLLQVVLLVMPTFRAVTLKARSIGRAISIVKLSRFIFEHTHAFITAINLDQLLEWAAYHCAYEQRRNRANSIELLHWSSS